MTTKTCTKCDETKPLDDYSRDRRSPDGRVSECKTCKNAQKRAYREANREKINARDRAYREVNREKIATKARAYYKANREKIDAQKRDYHEANREKCNARNRAYREANRETLAARSRAYHAENREQVNARSRAYTRKLNEETRATATRNGEPWTPEEDHYLTTTTDTAAEAAFNLGRTIVSVWYRREKLRKAAA